ncbi:hypothetical protein SDC9_100597 [bioreactor metagenome]|uniref:Uncharacterized protein n=1 Tax=bioreactor metagenome TaxID=1076179 RepID=A0A645ALB4_9ZZZZ
MDQGREDPIVQDDRNVDRLRIALGYASPAGHGVPGLEDIDPGTHPIKREVVQVTRPEYADGT